jgi:hypothetical protein
MVSLACPNGIKQKRSPATTGEDTAAPGGLPRNLNRRFSPNRRQPRTLELYSRPEWLS